MCLKRSGQVINTCAILLADRLLHLLGAMCSRLRDVLLPVQATIMWGKKQTGNALGQMVSDADLNHGADEYEAKVDLNVGGSQIWQAFH